MTPGSVEPVLVLGLGNRLLSDDGVGLVLLEALLPHAPEWGHRVEFVDGGTQGLALLGRIARRPAVVMLDAVRTGAQPGTVHFLSASEAMQFGAQRATTAHEGHAGELLSAAVLLGEAPQRLVVVGVEPERLTTGLELSESVLGAVPAAVEQARRAIHQLVSG